jgi:hypothetical protein
MIKVFPCAAIRHMIRVRHTFGGITPRPTKVTNQYPVKCTPDPPYTGRNFIRSTRYPKMTRHKKTAFTKEIDIYNYYNYSHAHSHLIALL